MPSWRPQRPPDSIYTLFVFTASVPACASHKLGTGAPSGRDSYQQPRGLSYRLRSRFNSSGPFSTLALFSGWTVNVTQLASAVVHLRQRASSIIQAAQLTFHCPWHDGCPADADQAIMLSTQQHTGQLTVCTTIRASLIYRPPSLAPSTAAIPLAGCADVQSRLQADKAVCLSFTWCTVPCLAVCCPQV